MNLNFQIPAMPAADFSHTSPAYSYTILSIRSSEQSQATQ
jgi:hypothetical protein